MDRHLLIAVILLGIMALALGSASFVLLKSQKGGKLMGGRLILPDCYILE